MSVSTATSNLRPKLTIYSTFLHCSAPLGRHQRPLQILDHGPLLSQTPLRPLPQFLERTRLNQLPPRTSRSPNLSLRVQAVLRSAKPITISPTVQSNHSEMMRTIRLSDHPLRCLRRPLFQ